MKTDSYSVGVDETITINAVLEPTTATDKVMTWYVEDESIAVIEGDGLNPRVTGLKWGDTTIYGVTHDGGYTTSCQLHVGSYDRALEINDLYILDNEVKLSVQNVSNLTVARFQFEVAVYDIYDEPIICSTSGTNVFHGSYSYTLSPGGVTTHGRFVFNDYTYPNAVLGRIVVSITGYSESNDTSHSIREANRVEEEYKSSKWVGPILQETDDTTDSTTDTGAAG